MWMYDIFTVYYFYVLTLFKDNAPLWKRLNMSRPLSKVEEYQKIISPPRLCSYMHKSRLYIELRIHLLLVVLVQLLFKLKIGQWVIKDIMYFYDLHIWLGSDRPFRENIIARQTTVVLRVLWCCASLDMWL